MLSPADATRLSEHIMKVTDVLCLSAVTIRRGTRRASQQNVGMGALARLALELQEARQVREGAPQP